MFRRLILPAVFVSMGILAASCGEVVSVDAVDPGPPGDIANSLMLSWSAPTTNEDGTPLEDLAGYRLHYGTESGHYTYVVDVGDYTSAEVGDLAPDTWYLAVTAYDFLGNESGFSNEIHYTFH